jgi:hypothetical protein
MAYFISVIVTAVLVIGFRQVFSLYYNYQDAKELGLPIIICPIDKYSIL